MSSKFLFCWSIQSNPFWTKWCLFVLSLSCHIVGILVTLSALSHPEEAFRNISCLPGPLALGTGRWTESDPMCPRQCYTLQISLGNLFQNVPSKSDRCVCTWWGWWSKAKCQNKFECFCNQEFQQKYRWSNSTWREICEICTFLNDILLDFRFYFIHVAFLFLLKHRLQEVHKILRHKPLS